MVHSMVNLNSSQSILDTSSENLTITVWQLDSSDTYNRVAIIDEIESLHVIYKYVQPSTFTLQVAYSAELVQLLTLDSMITIHSPQTLGIEQTECFLITYRKIKTTTNGTSTITVTGSNPLIWLKDRAILTVNSGYSDTPAENIAKDYVVNNLGPGATPARQYPNFEVQASQNLPGTLTFMNTENYPSVYELTVDVLSAVNLGQTITFNPNTQTFLYQVFEGTNHGITQNENLQVLFSPSIDNMMGDTFTESTATYKNTAYVYGQVNNTEECTIVEGNYSYNYYKNISSTESETVGNFTGLHRREVAVQADLSNTTVTLTSSNYESIFQTIGENSLITKAQSKNIIGSIKLSSDSAFKFNQDFQVGDTVTYLNKEWGVQMDVVIAEVRLQYSPKGFTTQLSLGFPLPTLEDKFGITLS